MKNTWMKTTTAAMMAIALTACSSGGTAAGTGSTDEGKANPYAYLMDQANYEETLPEYTLAEVDLTNADGKLKEILDKGTLVIATSPDYPPAEWIDEDMVVWGSEMMLAEYVAECLGVQLKIETMDFNGTLTSLDTNKTDMAFSGYGWKADRAESYELTTGYTGSDKDYGHTLITLAKDEGTYKTLDDFVGKHIMAQASSLQQMYVEDQILALDLDAGTNLELVATLDQAILGLASGKCDAVALDGHTAETYVAQSNGQFALTNIKFDLTIYGDYEGNVAAAKKGEESLNKAVSTIIDYAMTQGYYQNWYTAARVKAGIEE